MDCSPPGSSLHGILQARILEWVAISFSMRSSRPRDWAHVSCTGRWVLYCWATRETHDVGGILKQAFSFFLSFFFFFFFFFNLAPRQLGSLCFLRWRSIIPEFHLPLWEFFSNKWCYSYVLNNVWVSYHSLLFIIPWSPQKHDILGVVWTIIKCAAEVGRHVGFWCKNLGVNPAAWWWFGWRQ